MNMNKIFFFMLNIGFWGPNYNVDKVKINILSLLCRNTNNNSIITIFWRALVDSNHRPSV